MLLDSSSCSALRVPTRLSSNSCKLINMAEIGVFSSCDMVEIKVVLAVSSSWNSVIFLSKMTFPFFTMVTPSLSGIVISMYFTWKKLSLLSAYILSGSFLAVELCSFSSFWSSIPRIKRRNKSFFMAISCADLLIVFSRFRFNTFNASLLINSICISLSRPMIGSLIELMIVSR